MFSAGLELFGPAEGLSVRNGKQSVKTTLKEEIGEIPFKSPVIASVFLSQVLLLRVPPTVVILCALD